MRRAFSIWSLLIILFLSGNKPFVVLSHQKNLPEVYVYIDLISDITAIKAKAFLSSLNEKLSKTNIQVEFKPIENPFLQTGQNTIARITFDPSFNSERVIEDYTVSTSSEPLKLGEISAVLENDVTVSMSLMSPDAIDAVYAMILLAADRCDLAIPVFTELKISDNNLASRINYNLATCYLLEGNDQRSIELYKDLLYFDTPRFRGINLAWLYVKTGQNEKGFDLMSKAIETAQITDEGAEELLAARAQLYNLAFRYDDAINDLNTAIELSPNDPALYTLRGQTYLLLYEWDKVADNYNKALELDPAYADAYFYRGVLYYSILQTGQAMYNDALADFQHYLELAPNGEHAADATRYATDIQTQMNALNN